MFKIGDKIKAKKETTAYHQYGNHIFIVEKNKYYDGDPTRVWYFDHKLNQPNAWKAEYFELVDKKKLITEVDYLDAFKNNFSEGV